MDNNITVVVVCDDHYMILLAALLKSIEVNHKTNEHIDFYVVEDKVSKINKDKLTLSVSSKKISLKWIKMKDTIPKGISLPLVKNSYPLNTYVRLFIPHFIPKQIKRVIFLDVDMIMLEDISTLWSINFGDKIIAAVKDPGALTIEKGVKNYKHLNFDPNENYFNAGLQIINTDKWRLESITEKAIEAINKYRDFALLGDQYGLNVSLYKKWHELDPLWNHFCCFKHSNPYLIHFYGRKPIYYSYNNHFREVFYLYLDKTEWKNSKSIGEFNRYIKKIGNVLQKATVFFALDRNSYN